MKATRETVEDVYSAWPLFDPALAAKRAGLVPKIGVNRIKIPADRTIGEDALIGKGAAELQTALIRSGLFTEGYRTYLFGCPTVWQPDNRLVRYKKLWSNLAEFGDLGEFERSDELLIEGKDGIRFALIAAAKPPALRTALNIALPTFSMSRYCSAFLFLSKRSGLLSEAAVKDLYHLAFPAVQGQRRLTHDFDITNVCLFRCPDGDIIIRCGTDVHYQYFYIDTFAAPSLLARL
jgi:hypothetical protein